MAEPHETSEGEREPTPPPTLFERFIEEGIDWCRFCGTTEGVSWRPGPWGARTLCNRHGVAYRGYGNTKHYKSLDLSSFEHEAREDRTRPVVQEFCCVCGGEFPGPDNEIVFCEGCPWAYHQQCFRGKAGGIPNSQLEDPSPWYCTPSCARNIGKGALPAVDFDGRVIPSLRRLRAGGAVRAARKPRAPRAVVSKKPPHDASPRVRAAATASPLAPARSASTPARSQTPMASPTPARTSGAGLRAQQSGQAPRSQTAKRGVSEAKQPSRFATNVTQRPAQSLQRAVADASADTLFVDVSPTVQLGAIRARFAASVPAIPVPTFRVIDGYGGLDRGFRLPAQPLVYTPPHSSGEASDMDTDEDTSDEAYMARHRAMPIFQGTVPAQAQAQAQAGTACRAASTGR